MLNGINKLLLLTVFTACLLTWGCAEGQKPQGTPIERAWESPETVSKSPGHESKEPPAATTPPAERKPPAPGDVIATVNGAPIARSEMIELLIESQGLRVLESLILLEAAQQKAAKLSLTVTRADIDAAHADALQRLATPVIDPQAKPLDKIFAERLLEQFLSAKNISPTEWRLRIKQRAYLHKIAETEVGQMKITEDMLRREFELTQGEQVQIRHIQLASAADVKRIRALLDSGENFEIVAHKYSLNQFTAAHGGLTPPFTRNDPSIIPLVSETAFAMKVGEISSALQDGETYHIIKLERKIQGTGGRFENADRQKLKQGFVDRLVEQRQLDLEAELFQAARIEIRNQTLNRQFRDKYRSLNR